jgi:hypothetical protein
MAVELVLISYRESQKPILKAGRGKRSDCLYIKILFPSHISSSSFRIKVCYYIILLYIVICILSAFSCYIRHPYDFY